MTLEEAVALAGRAHAGQTDQAGRPYIDHLLRVMERIEIESVEARMAAVLHDVLEDTEVTAQELRRAGCPGEVVDAVEALTKDDGESYSDFLARVAGNPMALKVKLADIADNSDEARLALLAPATAERLRDKYSRARRILEFWGLRARIRGTESAYPEGQYRYFRNHNERIGLMRQWQWRDGQHRGQGWPEWLHPRGTEGMWRPGSPYELDAITGMGEDPWSCGEGSDVLTERQARAVAAQIGVDLDAPRSPCPIT